TKPPSSSPALVPTPVAVPVRPPRSDLSLVPDCRPIPLSLQTAIAVPRPQAPLARPPWRSRPPPPRRVRSVRSGGQVRPPRRRPHQIPLVKPEPCFQPVGCARCRVRFVKQAPRLPPPRRPLRQVRSVRPLRPQLLQVQSPRLRQLPQTPDEPTHPP